ncbi:MAG: PqqD family protein [Pyrinomonadaceae bacterium]
MKQATGTGFPRARKDQLIVRQLRDEVLVYDLKNNRAHCLNHTAALVWKSCDGRRTVSDITRQLEGDLKATVDDKVVWLALGQLEKFKLLKNGIDWPGGLPHISRRDLIRAGGADAVLLPLVISISAPTAVSAATAITGAVCATRHANDLPGNGGCIGTPCVSPVGTTCKKVGTASAPCGCA